MTYELNVPPDEATLPPARKKNSKKKNQLNRNCDSSIKYNLP